MNYFKFKRLMAFLLCFVMVFSTVIGNVSAMENEGSSSAELTKEIEFEIKEDTEDEGYKLITFDPLTEEDELEIQRDIEAKQKKNAARPFFRSSRMQPQDMGSIDYETYTTLVRVQVELDPTEEEGFPLGREFPNGIDIIVRTYEGSTIVEEQTANISGAGLLEFPNRMRVYSDNGQKRIFELKLPSHYDFNPIIEQIFGAGNYNDGTKVLTMDARFVQLISTKFTTEWHSSKEESTFPNLRGTFKPGQGVFEFNLPKNGESTMLRNDNGDQRLIPPDILNLVQAPDALFKMGIAGAGEVSGRITDGQGDDYFYETVYNKLDGGIYKFYEVKVLTLDAGDGTVNPDKVEVGYTKPAGNLPIPTPPEGETFKRWKYEDGTTYDPNAPVMDDLTITAEYVGDVVGPVDPTDPTEPDKPEGYVTVTYLGGENGVVEPKNTYYVNPEKNITFGSIKAPEVTPNTGYRHTGWDVAANFVIKKDTTATAQYTKLDDLIGPLDPTDPNAPEKPDGYATLTYNPGENGTIVKENTYYVNPNANLTFGSITAPEVTPNTGYKFIGWDVDADFVITKDITATAQYEAYDDVIGPVDPTDPTEPQKPEGYVTLTYADGPHGKVAAKNTYYVNPEKNVTFGSLTAPEVKADLGYRFTGWDVTADFVINADTTATAQYEAIEDVIGPVDPTDPTEPEKPEGYVTLTYADGEHGKVADKNTYYVNPEKNVTFGSLTAPEVKADLGYRFTGWDVAADFVITKDTTATAQYEAIEDVIGPVDPTDPTEPEKPEGYVTLTYAGGEHGTVAGKNTYYVNPEKNITFGSLKSPEVTPNTGYRHIGWNIAADFVIVEDTTATAQYEAYDDVIGPVDPTDPTEPQKPEGYVTLTYADGEHGKVADKNTYYVNPEKNVTFGSLTAPEVKADLGYRFTGWDVAADFVINADTTATAQYEAIEDVIGPVDPTDPTEPEKPEGYVTLTYAGGEHGTVAGKNTYYVNPEKDITFGSITAPELTVDKGYEFTGWNVAADFVIKEDTVATAQYIESEFNHEKVVKIEITKAPDKVDYIEDDTFDPTGMEVTLTDSNGKTKVVPYDEFEENYLNVPTDKPLETSDTAVTVTYTGVTPNLTADQPITVVAMELSAKPVDLKQVYENEEQKITGAFENGARPDPNTSVVSLVDVDGNPIIGSDGNPITGTINPDGTFEFPIDDLYHNQQVKVQLKEEGKRPTISDEVLTIDKKGPVIDNVKATPSEDFIDLVAKVDEPDATVIVKVGETTFPATVDEEGNIHATLPKNVEGDIVIVATDTLGNSTEKKVDDPLFVQLPISVRGKKPYAGNFSFTAFAGDFTVVTVELVQDGVVVETKTATVRNGRATVYFGNEFKVGDILRLRGQFGNVTSEPLNYLIES